MIMVIKFVQYNNLIISFFFVVVVVIALVWVVNVTSSSSRSITSSSSSSSWLQQQQQQQQQEKEPQGWRSLELSSTRRRTSSSCSDMLDDDISYTIWDTDNEMMLLKLSKPASSSSSSSSSDKKSASSASSTILYDVIINVGTGCIDPKQYSNNDVDVLNVGVAGQRGGGGSCCSCCSSSNRNTVVGLSIRVVTPDCVNKVKFQLLNNTHQSTTSTSTTTIFLTKKEKRKQKRKLYTKIINKRPFYMGGYNIIHNSHNHADDNNNNNNEVDILPVSQLGVIGLYKLKINPSPGKKRFMYINVTAVNKDDDDDDSSSCDNSSSGTTTAGDHDENPADDETTAVPTLSPTTLSTTLEPTTITTTKIITDFHILDTISHDQDAFTQGLVIHPYNSSIMYESNGLYGESDIRIYHLNPREQQDQDQDQDQNISYISSTIIKQVDMDKKYFGEGLCWYMDKQTMQERLIQITWKSRIAFIYDAITLDLLDSFTYTTTTNDNEGWGITYDMNKHVFYVSDGSAYILIWNATTFQEIDRIHVTMTTLSDPDHPDGTDGGSKYTIEVVNRINELEWDIEQPNTILGNVWYRDYIIRIDIMTGYVVTLYDLNRNSFFTNRTLYKHSNVLNGIAKATTKISTTTITSDENENDEKQVSSSSSLSSSSWWITGKKWPFIYRVSFVEDTIHYSINS